MKKNQSKPFSHKTALVESKSIGKGTRIWAWSHIQKDVVIGEECNIGEHCFIENGVRIGNKVIVKNGISLWSGTILEDGVFLGPNAVLTNERFPRSGFRKEWEGIRICQGASIGAGSVILPGVVVGRYASVGAGTLVTKDVPNHALAYGTPVKVKGWMCICGLKLVFKNKRAQCSCGRKFLLENMQVKLIK
jgi:acetyltransferase-like isoleucine patch superfamily enzyme